ncbi:MAG TPA: DUF2059 domain-containing protein [Polyangiaceae bacterium]|jgi:hypothetical protein|nr:DUF2059 domain-containing protein [Polyangiaceae bacterium]
MKKLMILAAILAASAGGICTLHAAPSAGAATAQDSTAMKLSRMVLTKETYKDMMQQTARGIIAGAESQGQTIPKEAKEKLAAVTMEALPYDELLSFNSEIYGARFSDKELEDIMTFYRTPTGVKLVKELPGITKDASIKIGALIPQRMPALLKKYGLAK